MNEADPDGLISPWGQPSGPVGKFDARLSVDRSASSIGGGPLWLGAQHELFANRQ